ncbi:MAG: hypothetical protein CL908_23640, partial [Deltaproteobacteria bacterium]|nr:hypothetical protein [Deltaproteobacteria bacterium]
MSRPGRNTRSGRRSLQLASIGSLALFLLLPAAVYLASGSADGFVHGKSQPEWPTLQALIAPDPEGRAQLAEALLDRLALRREAIRLRNRITWRGLAYIDTDLVVSGADGWLFYKPALRAWDCEHHAVLDRGLHRLHLLLDLTEVNDVPLVIAIAPNKASIHRGAMTGRAAHYGRCYFDYEARFRSVLESHDAPRVIDHARVLDPLQHREETYLRTDTHWNRKYAYQAIAQLAAEVGIGHPSESDPEIILEDKVTDLGNQILLMESPEPNPTVVLSRPPSGAQTGVDAPHIMIIHDSFYQEASEYLAAMIPNATLSNINYREFRNQSLDDVDVLVLASAERAIL